MLTTKEVMEWLKPMFPEVPKWGNGGINKNEEKTVGLYTRANGKRQPKAIGCESGYGVRSMCLLVHWGEYTSGCEEQALSMYEKLSRLGTDEAIGQHSCWIVTQQLPVLVGRDENGFYEAVIDFDIYFRR